MTRKFIVADTSVLLNFICANQQDLLLKFVDDEQLHVPPTVRDEVERKLRVPQFQCGAQTWASLIAYGHVHVLNDDMDRFFKFIRLFAGPRFSIQGGMAKNLGEYVAIAHCLALLDEDPSVGTGFCRLSAQASILSTEISLAYPVRCSSAFARESDQFA